MGRRKEDIMREVILRFLIMICFAITCLIIFRPANAEAAVYTHVTFDPQGGTNHFSYKSSSGNTKVTDNEIYLEYKSGVYYTQEVPTKVGYKFEGYYTGKNGTGDKVYGTGIDPSDAGAKDNPKTPDIDERSKIFMIAYPARGYWKQTGQTACEWQINGGSLTLYAHWVPEKTTVTFDAQGGTTQLSESDNKLNLCYDKPNMCVLPIPVKDGYTFDGYYTGKNGTGKKVYGIMIGKDGRNGMVGDPSDGYWRVNDATSYNWIHYTWFNTASSVTLYANWLPNDKSPSITMATHHGVEGWKATEAVSGAAMATHEFIGDSGTHPATYLQAISFRLNKNALDNVSGGVSYRGEVGGGNYENLNTRIYRAGFWESEKTGYDQYTDLYSVDEANYAGTVDNSRPLEGLRLNLTGNFAKLFDVEYYLDGYANCDVVLWDQTTQTRCGLKGGTRQKVIAKNGASTGYTGSTVLIRNIGEGIQLIPHTYTITLDTDGGESATTKIGVTAGSTDNNGAINLPTKQGYRFLGYYYTDTDGKEHQVYNENGDRVDNNSETYTDASLWYHGYWEHAGNVTLVAHWQYTIHFDSNAPQGADGNPARVSGSMADQTIQYRQSAKLTKNTYATYGYQFTGWNIDKNATAAQFADEAEITANPAPGNGGTLYAIWKIDSYPVTYKLQKDSDAETDMPTTVSLANKKTVVYPAHGGLYFENPRLINEKFTGWTCTELGITDKTKDLTISSEKIKNWYEAKTDKSDNVGITMVAHFEEVPPYEFVDEKTGQTPILNETEKNQGKFRVEEVESSPGYIYEDQYHDIDIHDNDDMHEYQDSDYRNLTFPDKNGK